jgi:hypothetical protein
MLFRSSVVALTSSVLALPLLACSGGATSTPDTATPDGSLQTSDDSGVRSATDASAPGNDSGEPAGDASSPGSDAGAPGADAGPDLDMQASDFECILRWQKVGDYRITNKLGDESGALAVANAADGGVFPVGTIVQLIPNEAMVKRYAGFSAATDDWEFFNLTTSASGTVINQRGGASVTNFAGGSCASCHGGAAPQWDMICGTTHGCAPLPINETAIQSIQNGDPRCVDGG